MKSKIVHIILSLLLSIIVILPYAIQSVHAFKDHEHKTCTSKIVKHFHKKEKDCGVSHLILEQYSIDFSDENNWQIYNVINTNPTNCYSYYYDYNIQLKSSRAPPYFIV